VIILWPREGFATKWTVRQEKLIVENVEKLLTISEVAEMLGVPVATLYGWRYRGEGPSGYRIGRHVRYRRAKVEAWLERQVDEKIAG
jgi:excisionase family DNA binding protein